MRNDALTELDEELVVTLTGVGGDDGGCEGCGGGEEISYTIDDTRDEATVTIEDDDDWEIKVERTSDEETIEHIENEATFTVTRVDNASNPGKAGDLSYAIAVDFTLSGDATSGADYTFPSQIEIPQGEADVDVILTVKNDANPEDNELATLTLTEAQSVAPFAGGAFPIAAENSDSVTIVDDDHWSVKLEYQSDGTERLPEVAKAVGKYTLTRFDNDPTDNLKVGDTTYPVTVTFEIMGTSTATYITDYTLSAVSATGQNNELQDVTITVSPHSDPGILHTVATSIPAKETLTTVVVTPKFDWADEGEPGNQSDAGGASPPADAADYGEYIDSLLKTATWPWPGAPPNFNVAIPTPDDEKRVIIHDGALIWIRTDSDNNGTIEPEDDVQKKDSTSKPLAYRLGRVFMENSDNDNTTKVPKVIDRLERPDNFNTPSNSTAWDPEPSDPDTDPNFVFVENENDLAETLLHVWIDSLTPKDPGDPPVEVDVYATGSVDYVLWTKATKGRRLHYGEDGDNDGRTDEERRLATLTDGNTTYDKTVHVEANTYDSSKQPVSLHADVVGGGPDGSDTSYYTTLAIDALAMAFNHAPADNGGTDGLNIRQSEVTNTEIIAPEWNTGGLPTRVAPPTGSANDGSIDKKAVLFLADKAVTVYSRIAVDPKFAGLIIFMKAVPKVGTTAASIGELQEVAFEVGADGILRPSDTTIATKSVNGYDDFTEFEPTNNTATTVLREEVVYSWEVTKIGKDDKTLYNVTGSNKAVVTDPIKTYTILDTPLTPWDVADDHTKDDTRQPWVSALEFATAPTKANASGQNDEGALAAITNFLFRQSKDTDGDGDIDVYGHNVVYAARRGAPTYLYFKASNTWAFQLSGYMSKSFGNLINCYDQAGAVTSLGWLLGIGVEFCLMQPFGYLNPTHLVGIPGETNNPFFRQELPNEPQLMGVDDASRSSFINHAFTRYNGKIYDACSGPDEDHGYAGFLEATYLTTVIDKSTPAEAAKAGDSSDILVLAYHVTTGIL